MTFWVEEGPSDAVLFPDDGPYDRRLGYVDLPGFIDSLERQGYAIESQARISDQFAWYFGRTGIAPYREKTAAGLTLLDRDGQPELDRKSVVLVKSVYVRVDLEGRRNI